MKIFNILFFSLFTLATVTAQVGKHPTKSKVESIRRSANQLQKVVPVIKKNKSTHKTSTLHSFQSLSALKAPVLSTPNLTIIQDKDTQLPIFIKGTIGDYEKGNTTTARAYDYLEVIKSDMQIKNTAKEFVTKSIHSDKRGMTHIKMQQTYQGIPVYGSEIILHEKNGKMRSMNGRYFPTPIIQTIEPHINSFDATMRAMADVANYTTVNNSIHPKYISPSKTELVIYHSDLKLDTERLAWNVQFNPNIRERWNYFIDAFTGEVIKGYKNSCSFACEAHHCSHHKKERKTISKQKITPNFDLSKANMAAGPATATATDLFGINRTIDVYENEGTYFMIDASRTMFNNNQSNFPNEPVGTIWTIDGNNTSPQSNSFNTTHVTSTNNNWNNPTAVSAHYNAGLAYEYFKNTFGRESINAQGGNIVSIINVTDEDGNSMDNAFWNGAAMFYGNGNQAFDPLAKALDVAGHEMSHGVVQTTANLEYMGQSGSLNESFADIFGAMIDRNDWRMGEDVVNTQFFPSGALRDLSNPNNGGSQLGDRGWQPKDMSEFADLPNTPQGNNGGVHINSGIPNRAFYLIASDIGKSNAEDIYYDALTQYLTKSSQFVDLRIAVTTAATARFGSGSNEVAACENAFNIVGIEGGQSTNNQEDIEENPGTDYLLFSNANLSNISVSFPDGTSQQVISNTDPISKPSVTDDGSVVLFIGSDRRMYAIQIDWVSGNVDEFVIQNEPIWRNVAISKDGQRLAAITDDQINEIQIYDFGLEEWNIFELYNPTFTQGVSTGDVEYADVLEWDFSGQFVMYDAFNVIPNTFGEDISYWDVGFMNVWNNSYDGWAPNEGNITKLFSGLPENTSIGNPTFSKNSDFIVAFDFIDESNNAQLLAVNTETGATSDQPIYTNSILNYPNYSVSDQQIIFDAQSNAGNQVLGVINIQNDKITGIANTATVLVDGGKWGVWFAQGERELVDTETVLSNVKDLSISPNPTTDILHLTGNFITDDDIELSVLSATGQVLMTQRLEPTSGEWSHIIDLTDIPNGAYLIQLRSDKQVSTQKVIKF